jgi:hypothetical protein
MPTVFHFHPHAIIGRLLLRLHHDALALLLMLACPFLAAEPLPHYLPLPANRLLVAHARESLSSGIDFRFGGSDPYTGLDGSAYVGYLYQRATGVSLPRTVAAISKLGSAVPRAQMMPGDLVFFRSGRRKNTHVGIYLGNQQFIHVSQKYAVIRLASLTSSYWQPRFQGARRLLAQTLSAP